MSETENKPVAGVSYLKTLTIISAVLVVISVLAYLAIVEQWSFRTAVLRVLAGIIGGGVFVLLYALINRLFHKHKE